MVTLKELLSYYITAGIGSVLSVWYTDIQYMIMVNEISEKLLIKRCLFDSTVRASFCNFFREIFAFVFKIKKNFTKY